MRISHLFVATALVSACAVDDSSSPPNLAPALGLEADNDYAVTHADRDAVHVEQRYRGIPVIGGSATVHLDGAGATRDVTDGFVRGLAVDTKPRIAEATVRATVARALALRADADVRVELAILPQFERIVRATGRALATTDRVTNAEQLERRLAGARLVYRVQTAERHPHRELLTLVDARTGDIISSRDAMKQFTTTGTAHTFFSRDQTVDIDGPGFNGLFQLEDPKRGFAGTWDEGVEGNQLVKPPFGSGLPAFGDGQPFQLFIGNRATAGADAHWGRELAWDMFKHVLNLQGVDGDGNAPGIGVHDPDRFGNAAFSTGDKNLYFGDALSRGGTMCAVDVVAHEYAHAIADHFVGLPSDGEGAGLDEGNSDIWGTMTRIYFLKHGHDTLSPTMPSTTMSEKDDFWIMGLDGPGGRNMFQPEDEYWFPTIGDEDPHVSNGPLDRMFFFLAQGSRADVTSPTWSHSLPWGMDGLGNDAAARIWFRALTTYLQSGDGYAQARSRAISAVRDLFGQNGPEEKAVRNAFAGVDVGDPAVNAPAPPVLVAETEPNDTEATAQVITFPSTTPVPGLRKVDIFGKGTSKDDFQITVPCGKTFGARLEVVGDYDLAIFQQGSTTPMDNSTNGPGVDEVISMSSSAGCSGSTTFFVRVLFKSNPPLIPAQYILHLDRRD
jgi:Zn-dependent metalloprotease